MMHRDRVLTLFLVFAIGIVSLLCYRSNLGNYFTAQDTFPLIASSRVESLSDFSKVVTRRLMDGRVPEMEYYRPVAQLTYGTDYFVWKLNPFGYHLTNLVLHSLTGILVFFLALQLGEAREKVPSFFAAALFISHPSLVENVPAIARRMDILAALFITGSLLGLIAYEKKHKARYLVAASVLCFMALGSKESAIILPFLVTVYLLLFSAKEGFWAKATDTAKKAVPFVMAASAYLFARYMVLGALSGDSRDSIDLVQRAQSYFESTVSALFYPADLLGFTLPSLFGNQSQNVTDILSVAFVVITAMVFLLSWKKPVGKLKVYLFLLSWIVAFYLVCVCFSVLKPWYFYIPSIPAAILLVKSIQDLKAFGRQINRQGKASVFLKMSIVIVVMFLSMIIAGLVRYSPLIIDYPEWKDSGAISKKTLNAYTRIFLRLPDHSQIHILDCPLLVRYRSRRPPVKLATILADYSVQAWIDLNFPGKRLMVKARSYKTVESPASQVRVHASLVNRNTISTRFVRLTLRE